MPRYVWTNSAGTEERIMPIGVVGEPSVHNIRAVTGYYEEVQYTMYEGYFDSVPIPYTFAGVLFDGSNTPVTTGDWSTGLLSCTVQSGNPYVGGNVCILNNFYLGTTRFNVSIGEGMAYEGAPITGVMALRGTLQTVSGIFLTLYNNNWEITDTNLRNRPFLFIPQDIWDMAYSVDPYDPADSEYPDGTPDGGYRSGTANKGDATGGTLPTHPIRSGYGVHYMLVNDAQLTDFSNKMWGRGEGIFDTLWSRWKDYKFNPMAGVLTCHALPTAFYPAVAGAASSISIAGTSVPVSCTAIAAGIVEQIYSESLAGILQYSSFLDFDYLKIYAHIPFCGICEIPASACVGGSVFFRFRCDILTGNVACWVCTTDRFGASHQINCLTGNCAYVVPITGNDNGMSAIVGALSSNLVSMVGSFEQGAKAFAMGASPSGGGFGAQQSLANTMQMATAQHHTVVSGNVSGSVAILSNLHLFLDITYANPSYPSTALTVRGTPSDVGGSVGTFAGTYAIFSDVHADGISNATDEEKAEIEAALKSGVYV